MVIGFSQVVGVEYMDIFSFVVQIDFYLSHIGINSPIYLRGPSIAYVKKTFLNENLDEEVYLAIPKRT